MKTLLLVSHGILPWPSGHLPAPDTERPLILTAYFTHDSASAVCASACHHMMLGPWQ